MRRRDFISAAGASVVMDAAHAQQGNLPVIGILGSSKAIPDAFEAFRRGLASEGFVEGRNVAFEVRWADGQYDRLPALAADLVGRQVTVLAALAAPAAFAAKSVAKSIPVVFYAGVDPADEGLVDSLSRPGGNMTGIGAFYARLNPKRVQLLRELVPEAKAIGVLHNPTLSSAKAQLRTIEEATRSFGLTLVVANASAPADLEAAFAYLAGKVDCLIVEPDPFLSIHQNEVVRLAARHRLPAIYGFKWFVDDGGLMSYGDSYTTTWQQVGIYVGKILKGAKPSDLPIAQPTKFELVVNLKTAKALGLTLSPALLARADEVIE